MKLIVIHNEDAGSGDWSAQRVQRLLRDAGHEVLALAPDDEARTWLSEKPDAFVAAGGDGTVHDLLLALVDASTPVAIVPLGTANNVAHALGFRVEHDLLERVKRWQDNQRTLHVSVVEAGNVRQPFIESVGVGAFAKMRRATDAKKSKRKSRKSVAPLGLLGIRKGLIKKLLAAKPVELTLRIDDRVATGEYLITECLGLAFCGPRLHLAPDETPDDALLTVSAVPVDERETAAQWIATGVGDTSRWLIGRGRSVELRTDGWTHVDGQIWPAKRTGQLQIHAGAHTVRVMV